MGRELTFKAIRAAVFREENQVLQRHRMFAAGVSVALLFGAASPALAKPGHKGHAYAYGHKNKPVKAAKPAKEAKAPKSKARVNGGGITANGVEFSVQGRPGKMRQAHFNYTAVDGSINVRCRSFETYSPVVYVAPGPPAVHVTANCVSKAADGTRSPMTLDATFVDNGATLDEANITLTRPDSTVITDTGAIREGNINVRS